jgi:hypothetical protein
MEPTSLTVGCKGRITVADSGTWQVRHSSEPPDTLGWCPEVMGRSRHPSAHHSGSANVTVAITTTSTAASRRRTQPVYQRASSLAFGQPTQDETGCGTRSRMLEGLESFF